MTHPQECDIIVSFLGKSAMSCYFRHIRDIFAEAGITVTAKNKKQIDQTIHRLANIEYKKCMPDCWAEVKNQIADEKSRKNFIARLKKAVAAKRETRGGRN